MIDDRRLESEREFHNRKFASGDASSSGRYLVQQDAFDFYRAFIRKWAPGRDVLEYGCGPNTFATLAAARGAKSVVGIDISDAAIAASQARADREGIDVPMRFVRMDAQSMDFPDDTFDLVIGVAILHHLDLDRCFAEIHRVLRPGGVAAFLEPLAHNPAINLFRRLTPSLRTPDEHPLTLNDLALARAAGLHVDVEFFTLAPILGIPVRMVSKAAFKRATAALQRLDRQLFARYVWLRKHAWTMAIMMQKT